MAKICSKCAGELPDSAKICGMCGEKLPENVSIAQQPFGAEPPPPQAYPPPFAEQPQPPQQQYAPSPFAEQPPQQQYAQPQQQYVPPPPQPYQQPGQAYPPPPPQPQYPQQQQYAPQAYPQQQPYVQQPYPQTQQYTPQPQYYAPIRTKKPSSPGKVIVTLLLIAVILGGAGFAVYYFFFNTNTPEGVATIWIEAALKGDIEKCINHMALGDEILEMTIREGLASSKHDALKQIEDSMFGDIGSTLISVGMSLLDIKVGVSTNSELSAIRHEGVLSELRALGNAGDTIMRNATMALCDDITNIHQIGIGVSIFGFDLPVDQLLTLYVAKVNGKWLVLPIGFY